VASRGVGTLELPALLEDFDVGTGGLSELSAALERAESEGVAVAGGRDRGFGVGDLSEAMTFPSLRSGPWVVSSN
jgi:hypothetical protein